MSVREVSTASNDDERQPIAIENIGQLSGDTEEVAEREISYYICVYPEFIVVV